MNILLDTHIVLWTLYDPDKLSPEAVSIISDPDNWICVSAVSLWEIEIKRLKRPDIFNFSAQEVFEDCLRAGFSPVDLGPHHIFSLQSVGEAASVDVGAFHNDPFDKMLIAQAKSDYMCLITRDSKLAAYNEPCVVIV